LFEKGGLVFAPGAPPFSWGAQGQLAIEFVGAVNLEVVGQELGGAMVGQDPAGEDEDGIVEIEVFEAVGDRENEALVGRGELVEETDDFVFGLGVEAAGDFIAKEDMGAAGDLHGEGESALLSAGEDGDAVIGKVFQTDFREE
jgi:hypothetical protein